MKKLIYLSIVLATMLWQCTPKASDKATAEALDKAEKIIEQNDFRSAPPTPGPAPKIELGKYESFTMDNGLQVIVVENHKIPKVSYQLSFDMPIMSEGKSAGMRDMTGELLRSGTTEKSKAEIDEMVDFMGARLNASATGMFASSLKKHSEKLLDLMAEVLFKPSFPESEFEKIKKQTLSGLASQKEDPDAISSNVSSVLVYGKDHPYGEIVTEETIENITLEECKQYYKNYFQPNMAYLVVVGDVTPDEAKSMVKERFSDWKSNGKVKKETFKKPTAPSEPNMVFVNKSGAVQSVINVTYPVDMKPGAPDAIKASLMNSMYGGFFGSYLNQNLREDKAYTYGARSSLRPDKEIGKFAAGASVRNEVTDSALVQLFLEMDNIRNKELTDENLSLVKNVLSGNFARSLEKPQTIARFALNTAKYDLPADYYETYLEKVDAVTKQDIMDMAKKYIRPENAHIVVVGSKDDVADKLTQFAPDGVVHFYDNYGNEIKMDDIEIPDGMTAQKVIDDYINAIGGKDKLMAVNDMTVIMGAEMQGMQLSVKNVQKAPNKYMNETSVSGMGVMQKQVFDGAKGATTQMGATTAMGEDELAAAKEQAPMFKELNYADNYTMELTGIEAVEGKNAYKVTLIDKNGDKKTEFYDMQTSLKLRSIETAEQGGVKMTQTSDFMDYKAVDGVMVPHVVSISGVAPVPLKMTVQDVKINAGVDDAMFKVD